VSQLKPNISVFFPAYNEEENIPWVVEKACNYLDGIAENYEVIVVNDGSRDSTGEVAEKIAKENNHVRVINHPVNRGYGGAVRSGLKGAKYDLIFFTDGDGQFDITELSGFLDLMDKADVVAGYRINRKDPFYRLLNARAYGMMINLLFGLNIKDIDCAFKLFKKSVIDEIDIEATGALASAELLIKIKRKGYKIIQKGVNHYPRKAGVQTGAQLWVIFRMFKELWKLHKKLRNR
jgi:glycosyltransferase involved in cell wall biosynthesis